ncbi:MAG: hypothetical protein ABEJ44_07500 [Halanaeroarchaeum sp.]
MTRRIARVALAASVAASVFFVAVGPASAQSSVDRPAVVVDLETDGAANLTVVFTYDLTTDAERRAFETLRTDDEARAELESRFASRMDAVAAAVTRRTDRDVSVTRTGVAFDVVDDGATGVVRLTARFDDLAAVEQGRLVLTEPFASGFVSDRALVVREPAGYAVAEATPTPSETAGETVTWEAGTDFDGFELVLESVDGKATTTSTPGFGVPLTAGALAGGALLFRRRFT